MRIRKLMYDSFFVNNQAFSGVTSVDSLTSDLYFHFTDLNDSMWKLSGNTAALASGVILEDSLTTSITVTPTSITGTTGATYQLSVINQNSVNVLGECTFSALTNVVTVSSGGLITDGSTPGSTGVKVTHPDIPLAPTTVPVYVFWPGSISITAGNGPIGTFTGITGATYQAAATTDTGGYVITTTVSWTSDTPSIATVGLHTGLITFVSSGSAVITATYPTGSSMSRGVTVS